MNRIRNILEKLVPLGEEKEDKFLKNLWEGCLIGDDKYIRENLGKGKLSRLYSNISNKSILTEGEHNLIRNLILEIENPYNN